MKCPYCSYKYNEFDYEKGELVISDKGDFFTFPEFPMTRSFSRVIGCETMYLYGCPECHKLFME